MVVKKLGGQQPTKDKKKRLTLVGSEKSTSNLSYFWISLACGIFGKRDV
jgi:hypothetical protein